MGSIKVNIFFKYTPTPGVGFPLFYSFITKSGLWQSFQSGFLLDIIDPDPDRTPGHLDSPSGVSLTSGKK